MKRDQLIKFMIAQRIMFYEAIQPYNYENKVKELQAVIEMIDGLTKLEEDDTQENSFHQFMEMLLNSKDSEDTEE